MLLNLDNLLVEFRQSVNDPLQKSIEMFVLLVRNVNQSINIFLQTFNFTLTFNNFFGWTIKVTLT